MLASTEMAPTPSTLVRVAVPVPVDRLFTYRVPDHLRNEISPGRRLRVPFGRRSLVGTCIDSPSEADCPTDQLKEIHGAADASAVVPADLLELTRWIARYYRCSWGEVLEAVLPAPVRHERAPRTPSVAELAIPVDDARAHAAEMPDRQAKQARILLALANGPMTPRDLLGLVRASGSPLKTLRKKSWVRLRDAKPGEIADGPDIDEDVERAIATPPEPTDEQQAALDTILEATLAGRFETFLLHGVTGSGKTEVYLRALAACVESGRQAIVLVPEIALTSQTVRRFRARFERVSILHSAMSDGARLREWKRIERGDADVVIGPRSAVFAPVPRLGLLVIDEEHESTFKQQSSPRYHARDVGIVRAKNAGATVVLGSATPSLESWHNAQIGKSTLLELTRRVGGRPLPPIEIVDMTTEKRNPGHPYWLSRRLSLSLEQMLRAGEQGIFLLNRRGFSTFLSCRACGFVLNCDRCAISLTYHQAFGRAACHYCGRESTPPERCPDCQSGRLQRLGIGTERVTEELQKRHPDARIERMDSDTMRGAGAYERVLDAFKAGEIDVLVGTQMIAKGLHFPGVTLVGVVSADTSLAIPDFRAAERTFQLITQVAGRTGRGDKPGKVIVQTLNPQHPAIVAAKTHDFHTFCAYEIRMRQELGYPPAGRIVRILLQGRTDAAVTAAGQRIAERLRADVPEVPILGPAAAPVAKVPRPGLIAAVADAATAALVRNRKGVEATIDVDATSLL